MSHWLVRITIAKGVKFHQCLFIRCITQELNQLAPKGVDRWGTGQFNFSADPIKGADPWLFFCFTSLSFNFMSVDIFETLGWFTLEYFV